MGFSPPEPSRTVPKPEFHTRIEQKPFKYMNINNILYSVPQPLQLGQAIPTDHYNGQLAKSPRQFEGFARTASDEAMLLAPSPPVSRASDQRNTPGKGLQAHLSTAVPTLGMAAGQRIPGRYDSALTLALRLEKGPHRGAASADPRGRAAGLVARLVETAHQSF